MPVSPRPRNAGGPPVVQPKILRPRQSTPSYFYLYDGALSEPKHANTLARIETRLTDLELQGRVGRLGPLKSAKEMVQSAVKAGASTIVAVGGDQTIVQTINAVVETGITFGVIPVGSTSRFARILGLPEGEAACEVVAARKIEVVDVGKINNYFFLTEASIEGQGISIQGDGLWTIDPEAGSRLRVVNLESGSQGQDGYLELMIESIKKEGWFKKQRPQSIIPFSTARVTAADAGVVTIEETFILNTPITIEILPQALKVIVGKNRAF